MTKLKIAFMVMMTAVVLTGIGSAQGISPFTEIGNLEMETLAAIDDIIVELTKQTERIDSLNATEISEQAEQDGMQIDIADLFATKMNDSRVMNPVLIDNNEASCLPPSGENKASGWCPNGAIQLFRITDSDVTENSYVGISYSDTTGIAFCSVNKIFNGGFDIICNFSVLEGTKLHYIVVN